MCRRPGSLSPSSRAWHELEWIDARKRRLRDVRNVAWQAVTVLSILLQASRDGPIVGWLHAECATPAVACHAAVANHQLAVLEHERRGAEHLRLVWLFAVDRNVSDRTGLQMAAIGEAEQPRRRRSRHRGNLGERIFPLDRGQRGD